MNLFMVQIKITGFLSYTAVLAFILSLSGCEPGRDAISPQSYTVEHDLLLALNSVRASGCSCGEEQMPPVPPLVVDSLLSKTAQVHAQDMADRNYFDHKSPEGLMALARARQQHYQGSEVGEIIAKNYPSVSSVMKGWLDSEPHCRAIMARNFSEMGAARVGVYWVVNFGRP